MTSLDLFPHDQIIGVFRGFTQGSLEFHADLVLPYQNHFQNIPMHGQFVLVQLETPEEAVLGRVTALASAGRLSSLGVKSSTFAPFRNAGLFPKICASSI